MLIVTALRIIGGGQLSGESKAFMTSSCSRIKLITFDISSFMSIGMGMLFLLACIDSSLAMSFAAS
ncbi:hypothetical protein D3C76_1438040 [compost metagenome]